jgi:hypothetical protein
MKKRRFQSSVAESPAHQPSSGGRTASMLSAVTLRFRDTLANFNLQKWLSTFTARTPSYRIGRITRRYLPLVILILFVIGTLTVIIRSLRSTPTLTSDGRVVVAGPKATIVLNKEFLFPLKDQKGNEVTKIKYTIEQAELRNELIVKGKRAVAVQGRTFLILNLKVVNDYNAAIEMNVRDYIRLSLNGNKSELLAPEIHNDPVTIQAISTKITRLGFPIYDTDKNIALLVGEISAVKEEVPLSF